MPSVTASKSCRNTRSAKRREQEIKQENNILKIELNEVGPKQQYEHCETVAISDDAKEEQCSFDLSKVKIELIEENYEPFEEIVDASTTVDLNIVKNEHGNELSSPYTLLEDCEKHKIKPEPQSLEDESIPSTSFDLNIVKKEKGSVTLNPYILLEDCSLNGKIKIEPKTEEIPQPTLQVVKCESVETSSLSKETVDRKIKTEPTRRSKRNHVKIEYEMQEDDTTKKRSLRSATTPVIKHEPFDGRNANFKPPNWDQVIINIRKMRKERDAPIDRMGCSQWMNQGENPKVSRYQTFISLLLSSKSKDERNHLAMTQLRRHGLTIDKILNTSEEVIGGLVSSVTFWRVKASQVLRSTLLLRQKHGDDVPKTVEGLLSLPGVGPKVAHISMSIIWGKTTGIGVGSFVHRVANRLGWARTSDPNETRLVLESRLPRSYWSEINELIVGFGQQVCTARNPRCNQCLLAVMIMCPSAPFSLYYDM